MGFSIKKAIKKVTKKATGLVKNVVNSPVKAVSSLTKGDLIGAATNLVNIASMGTIDATGGKKGIINVNTPGYVAKLMGVKPLTGSDIGSDTGLEVGLRKGSAKKGLLSQLRQAKGGIGGGSYTETVKNPLGGSSSVTGR